MWAEVSVSHNTPVFDKHPDTQDLLIDIPVHSHRCEEAVCRPTTGSVVCVCVSSTATEEQNKQTHIRQCSTQAAFASPVVRYWQDYRGENRKEGNEGTTVHKS